MPENAVILRLCSSCRRSRPDGLRRATEAAGFSTPVRLVSQDCMNGCARPVSMAIQGHGRATFFFTGIDPEADMGDIVATLHAYLAAPQGWIEDARSCGRLRHCLVGRVPAL